jgi:hypothetical protein
LTSFTEMHGDEQTQTWNHPGDTAPPRESGEPTSDPSATSHAGSDAPPLTPEEVEAELRRIKDLPREVGVMLMTVGVLGFMLPGVVGAPAVLAGGLVLWPGAFSKAENWFERKFPRMHRQSLVQINRYLSDLEARFPNSTRRD